MMLIGLVFPAISMSFDYIINVKKNEPYADLPLKVRGLSMPECHIDPGVSIAGNATLNLKHKAVL